MTSSIGNLLSGRLLARNALLSLMGISLPVIVGLCAIPFLLAGLGESRFGLLAIVWMVVGYLSIFDLGLGRAVTSAVASHIGGRRTSDLQDVIWSGLAATTFLSILGAVLLALVAKPFVMDVLNVDTNLELEAVHAIRIVAAGLPVVSITAVLAGLLEAHQRFGIIFALRAPSAAMSYLVPLAITAWQPSLVWISAGLVAARLIFLVIYFYIAARVRPELMRPSLPQLSSVRRLIQFGGWLAVTNAVSPVMVYFDRFVIGAMLSMAAVAHYVTPYEVVSRLQVIPQAMVAVLFPALTVAFVADGRRFDRIYKQATSAILLTMLPLVTALVLFGSQGLGLWVGPDFGTSAAPVVPWLAIGCLLNGVARMPFTALQSAGRPDLTAKAHLAEVVPYLGLLWILTRNLGITGTAAAWCLRMAVDALIMNALACRVVPSLTRAVRQTLFITLVTVLTLGLLQLIDSWQIRAVVVCLIAICAAWRLLHETIWSQSADASSDP